MHIFNIMLGKEHGGLEQVSVDYHRALELQGHSVTSIIPPQSWAKTVFTAFTQSTIDLSNLGEWDPFATRKLSSMIKKFKPNLIICHGNRAIRLSIKASKGRVPIVGVSHNYNNKNFDKCDSVFCITKKLVHRMSTLGISNEKIFYVPNMIEKLGTSRPPELRTPPVIGAFGRFVEKKGFDIFIDALSILKSEGMEFKALLGGDGPCLESLTDRAKNSSLDEDLLFTGWVQDKSEFLSKIDLFVLPSRHEPFGLVLIEAMKESIPCISTTSEGPSEIIKHGQNGLLVTLNDPEALAYEIKRTLTDQGLYNQLGRSGYQTVEQTFKMNVVSEQLSSSAESVISTF